MVLHVTRFVQFGLSAPNLKFVKASN